MDFKFPIEQEMFKEMLQDFVENEIRPIAAQIDEDEVFPAETIKMLGKYGVMGIPFSKEFGGAGGNNQMYAMAVEEVSKACASHGIAISVHTSLCASSIYEFGTEEQKKKYLTPLADGRHIGSFGLTEPNAGTDAGNAQTVARLDGDHYVLNGSKIFITNAGYSSTYVVFAMTDKTKGVKGLSAFIVEADTPGFSVGKSEPRMGIRASTACELVFEDVKVPKENLLGAEGKGFMIAMKALDGGRIGVAAQAVGIAQGALDETIKYVKERKQFGRPLSAFQNTQFKLAEMYAKVEAARLLVQKAAWMKDQKMNYSAAAATAKLVAAETANDVTRLAVQLHGGYGYTREYPIERMMRDAKITEIYEGTSEVMKMVISGTILR
jgi:butyryl-CoA dehydrogenase